MIESVIIDSQEPAWVQQLKFGSAPVAVMALDAGDAMVATDDAQILIIERKTATDLLNSIRDRRLFAQCTKMREQSRWSYLVITGDLFRGHDNMVWPDGQSSRWDWRAVQGALLTVQELGTNIIYCAGDNDYGPAIVRLANRERDEVKINTGQRLSRVLSAGESALAELPGIGLKNVAALMKYAGSVAWSLVWLCDLSMNGDRIPGIGHGTKLRVRRALGLPEDCEFFIRSISKGESNE